MGIVDDIPGIRRILTDRELRGVLGHEMGHVKNRDILTSSIVATIAGARSRPESVRNSWPLSCCDSPPSVTFVTDGSRRRSASRSDNEWSRSSSTSR